MLPQNIRCLGRGKLKSSNEALKTAVSVVQKKGQNVQFISVYDMFKDVHGRIAPVFYHGHMLNKFGLRRVMGHVIRMLE